ncbi:CLUMA_CG000305, isoform A [Clunio marinus]|uniref:CLUMA_CG000305, isoform A n=1 Tax=Clunio marinus TaxID=568069 RepID=A0A1J1HEZ8_9DIPT|nr:CLUMA_CG000305, isoform A [Clunio marinus]
MKLCIRTSLCVKQELVIVQNKGLFCQRNFNGILFKNRVTYHCFMFDSLTKDMKAVLHFIVPSKHGLSHCMDAEQ